ncbi:unnamed protein product [Allacma fusca]|uniref:Uncharacterized protein n=1 Tax=Allacma fusca TaxID=39272 RepID=A0A8J2P2K5_9HEXA|nr:unnamed protein product [Allacma fusca]
MIAIFEGSSWLQVHPPVKESCLIFGVKAQVLKLPLRMEEEIRRLFSLRPGLIFWRVEKQVYIYLTVHRRIFLLLHSQKSGIITELPRAVGNCSRSRTSVRITVAK